MADFQKVKRIQLAAADLQPKRVADFQKVKRIQLATADLQRKRVADFQKVKKKSFKNGGHGEEEVFNYFTIH